MEVRRLVAALLLLVCWSSVLEAARSGRFDGLKSAQSVSDLKEWKKLLKTRNNVLALFANGKKYVSDFLPMFEAVATGIRGKGSLVFVDCSAQAKKMCKNLKVKPSLYALKHYKDGNFHKDYDRLMEEKSMLGFMLNPTADPPWSEDPTANNVKHIDGPKELGSLLQAEKKPVLMFFYAPWCGHCKHMKPEFAGAATEVKGQCVLAAMDVDKPEAFSVREHFNITGFPTIIYFEDGQRKFNFDGGRNKEGIVEWLKNPEAAAAKPSDDEEEPAWSEEENDVVHLTTDTFPGFTANHSSVLVMFYAPWCGHCKAMKPAYVDAARRMKEENVGGVLAAVDATKEEALAKKFGVTGFPTIKFFGEGELLYDYGYGRTAEAFVDFMQFPREPPPPEKDWTEEESDVDHLTEETFKSLLKKKKHSLVMFYAPWCGHCKAAKPEYTAAANRFNDNKKVSFAAVDCTKSEPICKKHDVTGFPTFIYFNYGKNPSPYYGDRSQEGFAEFMADPAAFLHDEL